MLFRFMQCVNSSPLRDWAAFLFLLLLNLACYFQSLGGYFHNDDLMQLPYLNKVFQGHPELLWHNFISTWMGRDFQLFYRPLIEVSMAFDYFFWKANPLGYHLSNLIYQMVSSFLLYLIVGRLMLGFGRLNSVLLGFLTACLFAVYPLHPEVVSWIIARVDGLCAVFYLFSIWFYLKWWQDKTPWALPVSLLAFGLSLLCKEVAAGLALALMFMTWWLQTDVMSLREKLIQTITRTWMFWALLFGYLLTRWIVLGSVIGGYSGAFGDIWNATLLDRLLHYDSFWLVIYPFNRDLFNAHHPLCLGLRLIYLLLGVTLLVRLLLNAWTKQMTGALLLAVGWFVSCFLPIMQVWNISAVLLGSRFIYLASAPLCMFLALLLFPFPAAQSGKWQRVIAAMCSVVIVALLVCFGLTTWMNNTVWASGGDEMRRLKQDLQSKLEHLPEGKKIFLIDFPQQRHGAHMFYHPEMFQGLVEPPLCRQDLSSNLYLLEPTFHDDEDLANQSQLRQISAEPENELMFWDPAQMKFVTHRRLPALNQEVETMPLQVSRPAVDGSLDLLLPSNLSVSNFDFLVLDITVPKAANTKPKVCISWKSPPDGVVRDGDLQHRLLADGQAHTCLIALSEHKSWILASAVSRLHLSFKDAAGAKVSTAYLLPGRNMLPVIGADFSLMQRQQDGCYTPKKNRGGLCYDVSAVKGAQSAVIEMTRPGVFFKQYTGTLRDTNLSAGSVRKVKLSSLKGCWQFPAGDLPPSSWIQARVAAVDAGGNVIGYVSDPVNLRFANY